MESREKQKLRLIAEEAAAWYVRLKDHTATRNERHEYLAWLKRSPVHVAEILRIGRLDRLLLRARLNLPLQEHEDNAVESSRPNGMWRLTAAVIAFVLMIALVLFVTLGIDRPVETHVGEWRDMVLPDGSTAHLGPRTVMRLDFTSKQSVVRLARGEVMFDTANDPSRPFYVNVGLASVRASATRFSVSREEQEVLVTVADGTAVLSQGNPSASPKPDDVAVNAGQQASVQLAGPIEVRKVNVARETAWVQKALVFDKQTVAQAVYEFNRLNRVQIEVTDPDVAAQVIDGTFKATDPESFVSAVAGSLHLKVRREGADLLMLGPASL